MLYPILENKKAVSLNNQFNLNQERKRRLTFYSKDHERDIMFQENLDMSNTPRKSFDDTESRLEEKYGERFWQNQVQRVKQQNKNYRALYLENKKMKEEFEIDKNKETEMLNKKINELEEKLK